MRVQFVAGTQRNCLVAVVGGSLIGGSGTVTVGGLSLVLFCDCHCYNACNLLRRSEGLQLLEAK